MHEEIEAETAGHLWRYVQKHSRISTPGEIFSNITKLSDKDLGHLAKVNLLMSDHIPRFLNHLAPELLRRLTKAIISRQEASRTGIRGRVHWQETFTRRLAEGMDSSLYVTIDRSSFFDLPENRILKYLLQQFYQLSFYFQTSAEIKSSVLDESLLSDHVWKNRLAQTSLIAAKILKDVQLQKCGGISELSPALIRKISNSRNSYYRELSVIAEEFRLCIQRPEVYLAENINRHVLMPLDRDRLYELAVIFRILQLCPESGWHEQFASLIGNGGVKISTFIKEDTELHIYYQGLPEIFKVNSAYSQLMKKYSVNAGMRIPDIIMEIRTSLGVTNYFIIEVKRSEERTYIANGVYKLLGYLKDYETVRTKATQLRGVLVSWSGTGVTDYQESDQVYITQWTELDRLLKLVLA